MINNEENKNELNTVPVKQKKRKAPIIIAIIFATVFCLIFISVTTVGAVLMATEFFEDYYASQQQGGNNIPESPTPSIPQTGSGSQTDYNFVAYSEKVNNPPVTTVEKVSDKELSFTEIYNKLCPSIVRIFTAKNSFSETVYTATGFIISKDGYILTNAHVVDEAKRIQIQTYYGEVYNAVVLCTDVDNDIALLKVNGNNFIPAELADSNEVLIGEDAVAIGGPRTYQLSYTMTHGIVSGYRYNFTIDNEIHRELIQTDAPMNHGNSGGPLINGKGQVIGIILMKLTSADSTTIEGLGFAVPINIAKDLIDEYVNYGRVLGTPAFGVTDSYYVNPTPSTPGGLKIGGTIEGSDAEAKGLLKDDIITRVNYFDITSLEDFTLFRDAMLRPYEEVELTIFRNGRYEKVTVVLGEFK